jgi:hypothetical protein
VIHWPRLVVKEDIEIITVLIVNHEEEVLKNPPIPDKDIHTILTIPPNMMQYNSTLEWPKYFQKLKIPIYIHTMHPQSKKPPPMGLQHS